MYSPVAHDAEAALHNDGSAKSYNHQNDCEPPAGHNVREPVPSTALCFP